MYNTVVPVIQTDDWDWDNSAWMTSNKSVVNSLPCCEKGIVQINLPTLLQVMFAPCSSATNLLNNPTRTICCAFTPLATLHQYSNFIGDQ